MGVYFILCRFSGRLLSWRGLQVFAFFRALAPAHMGMPMLSPQLPTMWLPAHTDSPTRAHHAHKVTHIRQPEIQPSTVVCWKDSTPNACAYHLAAQQPSVLARLAPTHLGPPPRRIHRPLSPRRKSRDRRRRSPCTCCAADHARRGRRRRSPCTCCAPARARRGRRPRSPCTCCAAARARRCCRRRSPCTCCAAARARTSFVPCHAFTRSDGALRL